ncbi:Multidrug resistance protein MdtK [invertebrate metagenome]|uniref:Multidrug-efflux transporter n=1 Tax=invertebrate metagenome TaxID=1711999 RepID=A0A2H9T793_9ZZZZ
MSSQKYHFIKEVRALLALAIPLAGAQLVMCLAGFVDTLMASHYSTTDLAAVAIGYTTWIPINVFLIGLLIAKTAFVAQLVGAGQYRNIPALVHQGFRLALAAGCIGLILLYLSPCLLGYTGLNQQAQHIATGYLHAVAWGMPGVALNQVLRSYMEGQGRTRSVMIIQVLSLGLNIPFNYAMIYGKWGFPEMGGVGCGYATALIMWLAPIFMTIYIKCNHSLKQTTPLKKLTPIDFPHIRELVRVGLPVGCTLSLQFLVFTLITLLVTPLGEKVVGANQIAFNFSTLPFVIPSAIGGALTIQVGKAIGAGNRHHARIRGHIGMITGSGIALICALAIWSFSYFIVTLYTNDPIIIEQANNLMLFVAFYHILSSLQQITASSLRGYKDTRAVMFITVFSLWGIALPLGYCLARTNWLTSAMGISGFWLAIVLAFFIAVLLTQLRFYRISH